MLKNISAFNFILFANFVGIPCFSPYDKFMNKKILYERFIPRGK